VSEKEQDRTAYISSISFEAQAYALFGGFILTAITLILTLYPDPSTLQSQATLFFLTLLFYMLIVTLVSHFYKIALCSRTTTPSLPYERLWGWLEGAVWHMVEISVVLMFLLWNLFYLALASGIMCVSFNVLQYFRLEKPVTKVLKDAQAQE